MLQKIVPITAADRDAEAPMRRFSWEELRARLGAAHELRSLLAEQGDIVTTGGAGRFDVANAHFAVAKGKGKPTVNLDISANGKAARGIEGADIAKQDEAHRGHA